MLMPLNRAGARLRRSRAAATAAARYGIELLEERVLLNSYIVTNVNNSGAGSLRQAILDSNTNAGLDFIDFNIPGAGVHTIRPTFFLPHITDQVFLNGDSQPGYVPGQPLIELDGSLAGDSNGLVFQGVGGNWIEGLAVNSFAWDGIVLEERGNPNPAGGNTLVFNSIGTDPTGLLDKGNGRAGLHLLYSPNNTVSDNLISGNGNSGIFVADKFSTANRFERNLIGTDLTGLAPLGNAFNGISLGPPANHIEADGYASFNVIGGPDVELGNVIAGNGESGILIQRGVGNVVQGNYIGVGADGRTPIPNGVFGGDPYKLINGGDGVFIKEGSENVIGGAAEGAGNVISANKGAGVRIDAFTRSATDNLVQGNLIGTDSEGEFAQGLGNNRGVEIRDDNNDPAVIATGNHIGGTDADDGVEDGTVYARNVISGNVLQGISLAGDGVTETQIQGNYVGTNRDGLKPVPNGNQGIFIAPFIGETVGPSDIAIGGEEAGSSNVISGNVMDGIEILESSRIGIGANAIGTNKLGNAPIPNERGVSVFNSSSVFIGGVRVDEGENGPEEISLGSLISGNRSIGVLIAGIRTRDVRVVGNFIGADITGNGPLGNGDSGVAVSEASNVTIGGLTPLSRNVIAGNAATGVLIRTQSSTGNVVVGNYIGVSVDGTTPLGNAGDGVLVDQSPNNTIGGSEVGARNVISANLSMGIRILGVDATFNRIEGNVIGADVAGNFDEAFGNLSSGVGISNAPNTTVQRNAVRGNGRISGAGVTIDGPDARANHVEGNVISHSPIAGIRILGGAADNYIGGDTPGFRNVISATSQGVSIESRAHDNEVVANFIGTDELGELAEGYGNTGAGILVVDAYANRIRDNRIRGNNTGVVLGPGADDHVVTGNVITDNEEDGVWVFGDAADNSIRGSNVISGNGRGVRLDGGSRRTEVDGNFIGTDASGALTEGFGNRGDGVNIVDSADNRISDNAIRGNGVTNGSGVSISGADATGNTLEGNRITHNELYGVRISDGASGNFVGVSIRNHIAANFAGVSIEGQAFGNFVLGNYIGTDEAGVLSAGFGNLTDGVVIIGAFDNVVDGNTIRGNGIGVGLGPGADRNKVSKNVITDHDIGIFVLGGAYNLIGGVLGENVVSANTEGISLEGGAHHNDVLLNNVGTNEAGEFQVGLGNAEAGIILRDSPDNTVLLNTVRGNATGVLIAGTAAKGNRIAKNVITHHDGHGVHLTDGASDNVIGGAGEDDANRISGNLKAGVFVQSGTGNAVLRNRIFANGGLGIDLGPEGHTPNDQRPNKDADTGPNNYQNFPELGAATVGGSRRITGTLKSAAGQLYVLEFFASDDPDSSGFGEGQRFVTTTAVTTNASGVAFFDVFLPEGETTFSFLSATATDANGNTSEFSKWIRVATDSDGDGVSDSDESGGANGGDGNADGVRDSDQPHVASLRNSATGAFVTLEAPAGTTLRNVRALENPSPDNSPTEAFSLGFFDFSLGGLAPGASVPVKLYLPAGVEPRSYSRYGPTPDDANPHWYNWFFDGSTGAVLNGNVVTLNFLDGGRGDDDLTANGTVVDAGAPGFPFRLVVTNTLNSGPGSLRQAIFDANAILGLNFIDFSIGSGVQTIQPASALPNITDPVVIDGTTQPGFAGSPIIELSGALFAGIGLVVHASDTVIRGLVVNRFADVGILVASSGSLRPNNVVVEGNFLGTDVTGMLSRGNGSAGVDINAGNGHRIGGTTPAARNVISGNRFHGIFIAGGSASAIQGNLIGTAVDGVSPLGNGETGVRVHSSVTALTIGGLEPGAGNVIAFNNAAGVFVQKPSQSYAILSNSIHHNGLLGINVQNTSVNLNDPGLNDGTSGNDNRNHQNYPVLGSAQSSAGQTTISGYLNSRPDSTFLLQFFSNTAMELSGFGEGETLIGSATVTTGADGYGEFTATFDVALPFRTLISATATDAANNTSEFSRRLAVGDVLGAVYTVNTTDDVDDGIADAAHTSLREAIHAANNHPGLDVIRFGIGSGVKTIAPLSTLPAVTDPVTIDGTTQPGFAGKPVIELVGTQVARDPFGPAANGFYLYGLTLFTNDSTVRGLAINRFFVFGAAIPTDLWGGTPLGVIGDGNVLEGNFIGTDVTGTIGRANLSGVEVRGSGNRIGGTTPQARNLFSGNQYGGLSVQGAGNVVQGNFIGTDVTGTKAIGNGRGTAFSSIAVDVFRGRDNVIGGAGPGERNVISGNLADGIRLLETPGTVVRGNFIGTDVTGTVRLGNQGNGIRIDESSGRPPRHHVTIGGTLPGEGNLISANSNGILILSSWDNVVQGNRIGTDVTGTLDFGNGIDGVEIIRGDRNLIGGAAAGAGNLISGNNRFGVLIVQAISQGNAVQGNRIGTQIDGISALGNSSDGVNVNVAGTSPSDNLIGGMESGAGNTIAFNGGRGVNILAGQRIGILSNVIFSNGQLGIDLNANGVTPNDAGDADAPTGDDNGLQNYPVLTVLATDGAQTTVEGMLNAAANTVFRLQFFASPAADPTGFGEGQTLLGTRLVSTDAAGNAGFTVTFPAGVPVGRFVTATATDPANNTSEFARALQVAAGTVAPNQPPTARAGGPYVIDEGGTLALDASTASDPDGDPLTYAWDVNGDGDFTDATGFNPTLSWTQLQALGILDGPASLPVQVRVDDGQGHEATSAPGTLDVRNVAPSAEAGPDQTVFEMEQVTFSGTFTDPGTADTHTLLWRVDASNGQVIADGSGATFSFVPLDNGIYTVTFTVTDSDQESGTAVVKVNVFNADPTATIASLPASGTVGVPINLGSSASDPSPVDVAAGLRVLWFANLTPDYEVEFSADTPDFSFTPTEAGIWDVVLIVRDKDFGRRVVQVFLEVFPADNGAAPSVSLAPDTSINEGSNYTSSGFFTDPDSGDPWAATVDYGDGSGEQPLALNPDSTFDLSHVYADNGTYDVVVRVTDAAGAVGSGTTRVTVNNVAPAVTLGTPASAVNVGAAFTLAGSFTDPGTADTWTATVNYGDGSGETPLALNADGTFALSHAYQTAGSFTVTVTVSDDDNGAGQASRTATVVKLQAALAAADTFATYGGLATLSATLSSGGTPVTGQTLVFKLNDVAVGAAVTNSLGVATLADVSLAGFNAGSATVSVSFAGDDQHDAASATSTLTIARATLLIAVGDATRVYGQANPALAGTIAGLENGDDIQAVYATAAVSTSPVGTYATTAQLVDPDGRLGNYDVTVVPGTLTVTATTLAATGGSFAGAEGATVSGVLATFTTDNPIAAAGDFTATIDWGDGQTSAATVQVSAGSGFEVVGDHTYADNAGYVVTVSIHDNAGLGSASANAAAAVSNAAPTVVLADPTPVNPGAPFTLAGSFTDPGTADTWTAAVNYGDGTGDQDLTLQPDGSFTLDHTYQTAGSFTVTVTVSDDDGGAGTATATATVERLGTSLAAAGAAGTYGGTTSLSVTLTAGATPLAGKTLVFSINGVPVGSANTDASGVATLAGVSLAGLNAGAATVSVSFAEDGQHAAAVATAVLTIARASLLVAVGDASRIYGHDNPPLAGVVSGLTNGDLLNALYTTAAVSTSPVGAYAITAVFDDPDGRLANYDVVIDDGTLTVLAATLAAAGANISGMEGAVFTDAVVATFSTDNPIAAAGDFTAAVDWGDGQTSAATVRAATGGIGFEVVGAHAYADSGAYAITVSIDDNAGEGFASVGGAAAVANVAPTPAILGAPGTVPQGSSTVLTAAATDPSTADAAAGFTYAWTVTRTKDGVTSAYAQVAGPTFTFTPRLDGVYTVTLTATDKDGGATATSRTINVTPVVGTPNVAPVVTITGPAAGAVRAVGTTVLLTGSFTDPDSPAGHTAVWTITAPGQAPITVTGVVGPNGRVTGSYVFTAAGIYQISLTVTDSLGASGRATTVAGKDAQLVVFDECGGGKITGGGWIDSPKGADPANPSSSGKANFGFNAQYMKRGSAPTGNLQFSAGKLKFQSAAFEWLVVTGAKAQLKGTGTVNGGRTTYAFLLTLIDGKPAGGIDRFRLRIWNPATGAVVYDNLTGAPDHADPTAPVRGGNATIHKTKPSDCGCGCNDDDDDDDDDD